MNNNHKQELKRNIESLRLWVDGQTERYHRACECLTETKASLATTKMVKRLNNESFTIAEQSHYNALIEEAYNNVSSSLLEIAELKKQVKILEDGLLFLDSEIV